MSLSFEEALHVQDWVQAVRLAQSDKTLQGQIMTKAQNLLSASREQNYDRKTLLTALEDAGVLSVIVSLLVEQGLPRGLGDIECMSLMELILGWTSRKPEVQENVKKILLKFMQTYAMKSEHVAACALVAWNTVTIVNLPAHSVANSQQVRALVIALALLWKDLDEQVLWACIQQIQIQSNTFGIIAGRELVDKGALEILTDALKQQIHCPRVVRPLANALDTICMLVVITDNPASDVERCARAGLCEVLVELLPDAERNLNTCPDVLVSILKCLTILDRFDSSDNAAVGTRLFAAGACPVVLAVAQNPRIQLNSNLAFASLDSIGRLCANPQSQAFFQRDDAVWDCVIATLGRFGCAIEGRMLPDNLVFITRMVSRLHPKFTPKVLSAYDKLTLLYVDALKKAAFHPEIMEIHLESIFGGITATAEVPAICKTLGELGVCELSLRAVQKNLRETQGRIDIRFAYCYLICHLSRDPENRKRLTKTHEVFDIVYNAVESMARPKPEILEKGCGALANLIAGDANSYNRFIKLKGPRFLVNYLILAANTDEDWEPCQIVLLEALVSLTCRFLTRTRASCGTNADRLKSDVQIKTFYEVGGLVALVELLHKVKIQGLMTAKLVDRGLSAINVVFGCSPISTGVLHNIGFAAKCVKLIFETTKRFGLASLAIAGAGLAVMASDAFLKPQQQRLLLEMGVPALISSLMNKHGESLSKEEPTMTIDSLRLTLHVFKPLTLASSITPTPDLVSVTVESLARMSAKNSRDGIHVGLLALTEVCRFPSSKATILATDAYDVCLRVGASNSNFGAMFTCLFTMARNTQTKEWDQLQVDHMVRSEGFFEVIIELSNLFLKSLDNTIIADLQSFIGALSVEALKKFIKAGGCGLVVRMIEVTSVKLSPALTESLDLVYTLSMHGAVEEFQSCTPSLTTALMETIVPLHKSALVSGNCDEFILFFVRCLVVCSESNPVNCEELGRLGACELVMSIVGPILLDLASVEYGNPNPERWREGETDAVMKTCVKAISCLGDIPCNAERFNKLGVSAFAVEALRTYGLTSIVAANNWLIFYTAYFAKNIGNARYALEQETRLVPNMLEMMDRWGPTDLEFARQCFHVVKFLKDGIAVNDRQQAELEKLNQSLFSG